MIAIKVLIHRSSSRQNLINETKDQPKDTQTMAARDNRWLRSRRLCVLLWPFWAAIKVYHVSVCSFGRRYSSDHLQALASFDVRSSFRHLVASLAAFLAFRPILRSWEAMKGIIWIGYSHRRLFLKYIHVYMSAIETESRAWKIKSFENNYINRFRTFPVQWHDAKNSARSPKEWTICGIYTPDVSP